MSTMAAESAHGQNAHDENRGLTHGTVATQNPDRDLLQRHLEAGRLNDARSIIKQLLHTAPNDATLHYQQGAVAYHLGLDAEGLPAFQQACLLDPLVPLYHEGMGLTLFRMRQFAQAAAAFARASVLNPANAENILNLGACAFEQKQYESALNGFDYAAQHLKNPEQALLNKAVCLGRLKRHEDALHIYEQLKTRLPDDARMFSGYGIALHRMGRTQEAYAAFEQSIRNDQNHLSAWLNWGVAAMGIEDMDRAESSFRRAIQLGGGAEAQWNLSMALLAVGQYEEGFALHEARLEHLGDRLFRAAPGSNMPYLKSLSQANGQRIFLYDEQGLGDAIQFVRYLQMLKTVGAHISLRVYSGLRPLIESLQCVDHWVSDRDPAPAHDFQCPLMSLAHVCGTTSDAIPSAAGYLSVPAGHWAAFLDHLDHLDPVDDANGMDTVADTPRPIWGLMWGGNPMNPNDARRSIPLSLLLACLDEAFGDAMSGDEMRSPRFVTLTNALSVDDEQLLAQDGRILNLSRELHDFADTAALLSRCERVIVVDTSVAHLAGALGVRTHLVIPRAPDWRWGLQGDTTGWYDSVRLFRQQEAGQWRAPLMAALQIR